MSRAAIDARAPRLSASSDEDLVEAFVAAMMARAPRVGAYERYDRMALGEAEVLSALDATIPQSRFIGPGPPFFALAIMTSEGLTESDRRVVEELIALLSASPLPISAAREIPGASEHPVDRWAWPLTLALDGHGTLASAIGALHWKEFVTPVDLRRAEEPIELLVLEGSLEAALRAMKSEPPPQSVQTVVCFSPGPDAFDLERAEALLDAARADIVLHVPDIAGREAEWLDATLEQLAHDLPIDVAVRRAARERDLPPARVLAREGSLELASMLGWTSGVARALRGTDERASAGVSKPLRDALTRSKTTSRREWERAMKPESVLESMPQPAPFLHETTEATELARLGRRVRSKPPEREARYVHGRLFDGKREITSAPLPSHRTYDLEVFVAPPTPGALVAPAPFPDHELPPSSRGHWIFVTVVAPDVLEAPLTERMFLPREGSSRAVRFRLPVGAIDRLDARITLLHENRVLQSLRVRAPVGSGPEEELKLELEGVVRANLDDLDARRQFGAAILVNDLGGEKSLTYYADGRADLIRTSGAIDDALGGIATILEQLTTDAAAASGFGTPKTKATREALWALAQHGAVLSTQLRQIPLAHDTLSSDRKKPIQIIAATPDRVLPLELLYDGAAPVPAVVCKHWDEALAAGDCVKGKCPADKSQHVCPMAFWGLSRVIERHTLTAIDYAKLGAADFATQNEPSTGRRRLPVTRKAVCAAAKRARSVKPKDVDDAFKAVAKATGTPAKSVEVTTWKTWSKTVAERKPSLLVLLPHTDEKSGIRTLEIGTDPMPIGSIAPALTGAPPSSPGPLVLLLGCSTGVQTRPIQSFVPMLRGANAAVVVATLSRVLGREVAVVTKLLVEQLAEAEKGEGTTLGALMPALRRQLLSRGVPAGLSLVAFGDADWSIGAEV